MVKDALLGSTAAAGKPIEVWFQDEARVGQKGGHTYIWAPVGSRPTMVRDNRHDSAYLYGAICPARGVGAAIILPAVNTEGMNEHLREIATQVSPGAHAIVVCDGAGWHQRGKRLELPENITLLPLPPYSPELNPAENVWEYLRGNKLCAIVWDSYEAIVDACCKAWNFLVSDPDRIRSIGAKASLWAGVNVSAGWYNSTSLSLCSMHPVMRLPLTFCGRSSRGRTYPGIVFFLGITLTSP